MPSLRKHQYLHTQHRDSISSLQIRHHRVNYQETISFTNKPPSEDHRDDWFDVITTTNYRATIRLNMKSLDLRIASFQLFIEQTNVRKTSTFKNMNSLWPADKIRWYIISCFFNECQLPRVGKSEVWICWPGWQVIVIVCVRFLNPPEDLKKCSSCCRGGDI